MILKWFGLDRGTKKYLKVKISIFHLETNEHPILLDENTYQSEEYKNIDPDLIHKRMNIIRSNKNFIEKFNNLLIDMQEEKNLTQDQSEKLVEKQIYDGFPDNKDNYLMQEFHAAKSEDKFDIAEKITDHRYKEFAKRVMFNEYPEFLPKKELTKRNKVVAENHLTLEESLLHDPAGNAGHR